MFVVAVVVVSLEQKLVVADVVAVLHVVVQVRKADFEPSRHEPGHRKSELQVFW